MLAFCRGDSQGEWDQEVKEEGGVILVHSEGPFQEGFEGEWGGCWGGEGGNQNTFLCAAYPPPHCPWLQRAGQGLPLHGNGGISFGVVFFFFQCLLLGESTSP